MSTLRSSMNANMNEKYASNTRWVSEANQKNILKFEQWKEIEIWAYIEALVE